VPSEVDLRAATPTHVMVVDDDADGAAALAEALFDAGYRVSIAYDGRDALAQLHDATELPDVLLTDLVMPRLDGWTLAQEVCSDPILGRMCIVVMTASGPRAMAAVRAASGYIAKPVVLEQLVTVIEAALAQPRPTPRWKSGARPRAPVLEDAGARDLPAPGLRKRLGGGRPPG
jgi:CheY-like chemotaxis protein